MVYSKNFNKWNNEKQSLDGRSDEKDFFVNPRQIWYAKLGVNIGNETDGKHSFERPVLVLQKVGSVFRVLPMTTKGKDNSKFYHRIISVEFGKESFVILSQIRTIDKKRFQYPLGEISLDEFEMIKKSLIQRLQ